MSDTDSTLRAATEPASPDGAAKPTSLAGSSPEQDDEWFGDALLSAVVVLVATVVAVFAAATLATAEITRATWAIAVGALAGGALAFVATTRFVAFIIVLVVARGTLDGLKLTGVGGSAITEPGVMVGGVLLVACTLWLLAQRSAGTLRPLSRTATWLVALAGAGVLGALGAGERAAALEAVLRVVTSVLTFVVFEQLMAADRRVVRRFIAAGALSMLVPAFIGIQQLFGSADFEEENLDRIRGTFVHPNAFASYLVVIALVAFAFTQLRTPRLRTVSWLFFLASGALLLFTYGRAAWGGMLIGLGIVLWKIRPALVGVLVGAVLLAPLAIPSIGERLSDLNEQPTAQEIGDGNANSFAWRLEYWGEILPLWQESPVVGIGLDQVPTRTEAELQPHSVFVQVFVEMGLLGAFVFGGLLIAAGRDLAAARRAARNRFEHWMAVAATAVAVAFVLQMLTENLLTQVAIHLYLWIPLAFATSLAGRAPVVGADDHEESDGDAAEPSDEHGIAAAG